MSSKTGAIGAGECRPGYFETHSLLSPDTPTRSNAGFKAIKDDGGQDGGRRSTG